MRKKWFKCSGVLIFVMFIISLAQLEVLANDINSILLKKRHFVPEISDKLSAVKEQRHMIIQFEGEPQAKTLEALLKHEVEILQYIPKHSVMAFIPAGTDFSAIPGIRWTGVLQPTDKISNNLQISLDKGFILIDVFPDISKKKAEEIIIAAGGNIYENQYLLPNTYLVKANSDVVSKLSVTEEVSWIWPASEAVINGDPVYSCPGGLTPFGPVPNYATYGEGWDGPGQGSASLTYHFVNGTPDISGNQEETEVERGLNEWTKYASITWTETATAGLNKSIDIEWATGNHCVGGSFDAPGGVLAHCFYPSPPNSEPIAGDMHFDEYETWRVGSTFDLFSVALHEAGHALGIAHSEISDAVMYPYYQQVTGLHQDDIDGIQLLYSSGSTSTTTTTTPSTTTTSSTTTTTPSTTTTISTTSIPTSSTSTTTIPTAPCTTYPNNVSQVPAPAVPAEGPLTPEQINDLLPPSVDTRILDEQRKSEIARIREEAKAKGLHLASPPVDKIEAGVAFRESLTEAQRQAIGKTFAQHETELKALMVPVEAALKDKGQPGTEMLVTALSLEEQFVTWQAALDSDIEEVLTNEQIAQYRRSQPPVPKLDATASGLEALGLEPPVVAADCPDCWYTYHYGYYNCAYQYDAYLYAYYGYISTGSSYAYHAYFNNYYGYYYAEYAYTNGYDAYIYCPNPTYASYAFYYSDLARTYSYSGYVYSWYAAYYANDRYLYDAYYNAYYGYAYSSDAYISAIDCNC